MDEQSLLPVLSALGGVALAQGVAMLQSWLERKNKREVLLRTKYEELGQHFLASTEMPGRLLQCTTHEEIKGVLHQSAANQAQFLALIYFPPLSEPIRRYMVSYQNLCLTATNIYYKNPESRTVGMVVANHPDYIIASVGHKMEKENLVDEIEKHASFYTKS